MSHHETQPFWKAGQGLPIVSSSFFYPYNDSFRLNHHHSQPLTEPCICYIGRHFVLTVFEILSTHFQACLQVDPTKHIGRSIQSIATGGSWMTNGFQSNQLKVFH
jgi:hypothetical protein